MPTSEDLAENFYLTYTHSQLSDPNRSLINNKKNFVSKLNNNINYNGHMNKIGMLYSLIIMNVLLNLNHT
jgi:hypothetical protein